MKQSEAVRIPQLLAARQPLPIVEEATIEGIHMLVILGNEVDTVIRYNRKGGADMPQLCTYPDVAEAAAHADERLAKQRASGRKNTTGEGVEWPRNWKLGEAQAAGKIWYARHKTERKVEPKNVVPEAQKKLPPTLLSVEEMNDPFLEAVGVNGVNTEQTAMNESIKAAVQQRQNRVYSREEVGDERSRFRAEWARLIRDESKRYLKPCFGRRALPSHSKDFGQLVGQIWGVSGQRSAAVWYLTEGSEPLLKIRVATRNSGCTAPVYSGCFRCVGRSQSMLTTRALGVSWCPAAEGIE